jgi:hypothetical protein
MGWLLRIAILWGLFLPQVPGQTSKTFFEERLLDRAPIIVRAHYDADQSCFDVDVAAFRVVKRLKGESDSRILVLGATQLSQRGKDFDRLLFLKREPSGCLYRIVDLIDLAEEADATEAFVRAFLVVAEEDEPGKRRAGIKQLIADGFTMKSEFPRKLAARELERLARRTPPVLSVDELSDFAKYAKVSGPEDAERINQSIGVAENLMLKQFAGTQDAIPRGPRRNQYLRAVADYLRDSEPSRRDAAIDAIALRFGDNAVPFLTKVIDEEPEASPQTARALLHFGGMRWTAIAPRLVAKLSAGPKEPGPIIGCLGELGVETAVTPVSRYLSTADQFEAAALALARINTPAATRLLDGVLAQLRRDPRQQSRVELIEHLRSKEFVEEDAQRRIEAKGRYPRE